MTYGNGVKIVNQSPNLLFPIFREKVEEGLVEAEGLGLNVNVFEGYRSPQRQQFLYCQGRSEPGTIVTNSGAFQSWHQYGLAVDVVFQEPNTTNGIKWTWIGDWMKLAECMERQGLEWAGRWKHPESPHFQMTLGLDVRFAMKLRAEQEGIFAVWKYIEEAYKKSQN